MIFPLIANERIAATVATFINTGHFPHALLISGEAGLGKKTLAKYIACAAVCTGDTSPCGICGNCRLVQGNNHPDISVISLEDKKKSITVNQIRELRQQAYIKPQQGNRRVIIINSAHTLNEQSQNALLKILEEPPGDTVFMLLCDTKAALLPTVLSRCITLALCAPDEAAAQRFCEENTKSSKESIAEVLMVTRGNIGRTLALLKKHSASKAFTCAQEYMRICVSGGNSMALLKTVFVLEKDRNLANEWVNEIKYSVMTILRENYDDIPLAQRLTAFNDYIEQTAPLLRANINLSLFFSSIVGKTCSIFDLD